MRDGGQLEATIEALLADESYRDHPMREALDALYKVFQSQVHQVERIAHISDRYQSVARQTNLTLSERYSKQMRQLGKIARISDRYQLMMRDLNDALKAASTTDPLTGIGNRRMLVERLKSEMARSQRVSRPLAVAIADVDRFKSVNDTFGHDAGDKALTEIARTIDANIREYDCCGRWGGEEFLIIMPEISVTEGLLIIERVRLALDDLDVSIADQRIELSASFGIAQYNPGESMSDLINRADAALYAAKHAGRNQVKIAASNMT
ncbi:MAG: biofilm regulation diguanylate cyclase SiaD [Pseudomonadota bacterium]